jgi:4-hydroxy-3-methylbut-2-enyl diphosphate reductase
MVDSAAEIESSWVEGKARVGITAGASAPEVLVEQVIERLKALGVSVVRQDQGSPENVTFPLPLELQR